MGFGPAEIWLDGVSLVKTGSVNQLQARDLPAEVTIESPLLRVSF